MFSKVTRRPTSAGPADFLSVSVPDLAPLLGIPTFYPKDPAGKRRDSENLEYGCTPAEGLTQEQKKSTRRW